MADFSEALGHIQQAREDNSTAEAREKGVADDTSNALGVIGDMPNDLATLADVLDTQIQNVLAAHQAAEEAQGHVQAADEDGHFEESTNAIQLLQHVMDTSDGQAGVLTEAKEALIILLARLDEVKLSFQQVHDSADETVTSTGGAEENLDQLAQRLAG